MAVQMPQVDVYEAGQEFPMSSQPSSSTTIQSPHRVEIATYLDPGRQPEQPSRTIWVSAICTIVIVGLIVIMSHFVTFNVRLDTAGNNVAPISTTPIPRASLPSLVDYGKDYGQVHHPDLDTNAPKEHPSGSSGTDESDGPYTGSHKIFI